MDLRLRRPQYAFLSMLLVGCGSDSEGGSAPGTTTSGVSDAGTTTSHEATTTADPDPSDTGPGTTSSSSATASSGSTSAGDASSTGDEGEVGSDETGAETGGEVGCSVDELLSEAVWDEMFLHVADPACPGGATYSYAGLVAAAANYPEFACEGDEETRLRELVAFLAQISHETTGGWATAPDGPHAWGLCFNAEVGCEDGTCTQYCDATNATYPCAAGQTYHGRGAIQLSWNYNYGQAGDALGVDLLANPEQVATDPELAIATALWFWMTPQAPKPSAHDVMVGQWRPTAADLELGRVPGFGMTTNIINGGIECNQPTTAAVHDRVGYFERYSDIAGSTVGDNLYCDSMASY